MQSRKHAIKELNICRAGRRDARLHAESAAVPRWEKLMKSQIDTLVRGILYDLEHQRPPNPQLRPLFQAMKADNMSGAYQQRAVLASYGEEGVLSAEDGQYAREQLKTLPPF
jgi:hypothetical protein